MKPRIPPLTVIIALIAVGDVSISSAAINAAPPTISYQVRLETVMEHDDGQFLWFHPRTTPIPRQPGDPSAPVLMTLQRHLRVSDYYSGLYVMRRDRPDGTWSSPELPAVLDWRPQPNGVTVSVADVTPGWHVLTGKIIAIGARVRYSPQGQQLEDVPQANGTDYTVFDPKTGQWSAWQALELPREPRFNFVRNACAQWLVEPDGALLVPLYFGPNAKEPFSVTVARCRFDGEKLTYQEHGTELTLNIERGLVEPSLIKVRDRYYLTLRNDQKAYVTAGSDGLHFDPIRPWTFDDGGELGSYNTQQHWLAHGDGLFLVYTRRGANNDHVMRHRAPLFMAQVNPEKLQVIRATERVLIPERGATLGNFGASEISPTESWVTVSEGMWNDESRKRGARGATYVVRILWDTPPTAE